MTTFEVHYQQGNDYGESLIEADYPEQARQIFLQQQPPQQEQPVVLCVLRHNLPYGA